MGRKSEAAVLSALSKQVEAEDPVTELRSEPARWSIPRMLAVSAVISAGIWAVIIALVMVAAGG